MFARTTGVQSVIVAFNNDVKPATWTVDVTGTRISDGVVLRDRLAAIGDLTAQNGRIALTLPARSAAILTQ